MICDDPVALCWVRLVFALDLQCPFRCGSVMHSISFNNTQNVSSHQVTSQEPVLPDWSPRMSPDSEFAETFLLLKHFSCPPQKMLDGQAHVESLLNPRIWNNAGSNTSNGCGTSWKTHWLCHRWVKALPRFPEFHLFLISFCPFSSIRQTCMHCPWMEEHYVIDSAAESFVHKGLIASSNHLALVQTSQSWCKVLQTRQDASH